MPAKAPVFVTGASGFIARHIVLRLLRAGHAVRGSVRSGAKAADVRETMQRELGEALDADRLSFVTLDLTSDDGWADALSGAGALIHTASPFVLNMPRNEDDLIRPAVDGTRRALGAAQAAGVSRVVLTSSVVAVVYRNPMPDRALMTEADWSDPQSPACHAYARSKTLAERAAWDFVRDHPEIALTVINPGFVMGPPLDDDFAASMDFVKRVLGGKDPFVPRLKVDIVDVRDIAEMHVAALSRPETVGERLIGVSGQMWLSQFAECLHDACPGRRMARREAPDWVFRILGLFDRSIAGSVPALGKDVGSSGDKAREMLGMEFIPADRAVRDAAAFLIARGHVT